MAKEYNFNEKELELIQSTTWNEVDGVQELTTPYEFDETLGDFIKVTIFDKNNKYITHLNSNDEEILNKLLADNLQFIYRDNTNKIFIKVNELLRISELDTGKYEVRFDFLRNIFSDIYDEFAVPSEDTGEGDGSADDGNEPDPEPDTEVNNELTILDDFGLQKNPKFIVKEISNSRKEVRLILRNDADDILFSPFVINVFKSVMGTINDENYGFDFVVNLEKSLSIPINNYAFDSLSEPNADSETGELVSLILRVNKALPSSIELFDSIDVEKELITTHKQKVYYFSEKSSKLSTGGLSIDTGFEVNNDLSVQDYTLENYDDLYQSSSLDYETRFKIASSSKDIDNININYNEFTNHTMYGSVSQKLNNFYSKVSTLETYYNELSESLLQHEDTDFDIIEEFVTNGLFTASIEGWQNHSTEPYDTFEWSSVSQSLYVQSDGTAANATPPDDSVCIGCTDSDDLPLKAGRKYRYQFNLKLVSGTQPSVAIKNNCGSTTRNGITLTNVLGTQLNKGTFIATHTENACLQFHNDSDVASEYYVDNVSIGEVFAEKNTSNVISRRKELFENISEITQNFTPYEKWLYYDGQSETTSSAPGLGPNLATVGNTVPFSIDRESNVLTELNDFDGFNRVYKFSDLYTDDKWINVFQGKYGVENKPFFNFSDPIYLSFLYKGTKNLKWDANINNSNNQTYGTFSEPVPHAAFNATTLESQNNTTESKWHRAVFRVSQSYWRPVEGFSVGGATNPVVDWSADSNQVEIIPSTGATGSYPIQLFGEYANLASSRIDSGTSFTGSVLPAGELFRFGWISGSATAESSSYITDVKIVTTDPTNTTPFASTFLTSSTEFHTWYTAISASAVTYDDSNIHSLFQNLPIHYQQDSHNDVLYKFVSLVGEFFDVERSLIDSEDSYRGRDYTSLNSPPKTLLPDFLEGFGWELINPFSSSLSTYFGTGEGDILVDGNTIQDIEANTSRKLLNNLVYLYKSKGTANAYRALTNIFGYPADVLSVREGGGSLEEHNPTIISNQAETLIDGLENTEGNISFQHTVKELPSYVLVASGSDKNRNQLELPWHADTVAKPECIEFIFKPQQSSIHQVVVASSGSDYNNWNLTLESGSTTTQGRLTLNINNSAQAGSDITSNVVTMSTDYFDIKDGKLWNVMLSRNTPTTAVIGVTQSYELVTALQDKDKIKSIYTASLLVSNSNANTNFTASNLPGVPTDNLKFGESFTGSIAEIRTWSEKLNISKFKQHTLNKFSVVGNDITSSQSNLIYHFKLNEKYNFSKSQDNSLSFNDAAYKNIKDYSFTRTGLETFFSASVYDTDLVDVYSFSIRAGGLNQINDKKIITRPTETVIGPLNSQNSSTLKLDDDTEPVRQFSNNLYLVRTPQATLNDYIIDSIADFDISDYFGNPEDLTKSEYTELKQLRKEILDDRGVTFDINKWIEAQKGIFSEAFIDAVKSSTPAKAKLSDIGILIEPTILERDKIKNPEASYELLGISGSLDNIQYYDFSDSKRVASPEVYLNYIEDIKFTSSSIEPIREPNAPIDILSTTRTTGNKETMFGEHTTLDISNNWKFTDSILERPTKVNISNNLQPTITAIGDSDEGFKISTNPMRFNNHNQPIHISESNDLAATYHASKNTIDIDAVHSTLNVNLQGTQSGSYDIITNLTDSKLLTTLDLNLNGNIVGDRNPDFSKKWGRTIDDVHFVNYSSNFYRTGSTEEQVWYEDSFNNTNYYESQFYFQMIGDYEIVSSSKMGTGSYVVAHTEFENQRYFLNRQLMVQGLHKGKEIGHTRYLPTGSDGNIDYPSNHITRNPDPFHLRMIEGTQNIGNKFFNIADKDDLSTSSFYRVKVTGENKLIVNRNKRIADETGSIGTLN